MFAHGLHMKLNRYKGFCPKCGVILDQAVDCPVCGYSLASPPKPRIFSYFSDSGQFFRATRHIWLTSVIVLLIVSSVTYAGFRFLPGLIGQKSEGPETVQVSDTAPGLSRVLDASINTDSWVYKGPFVLAESSHRFYTRRELNWLTLRNLSIARNEIYARHGKIFDSTVNNVFAENGYIGRRAEVPFSDFNTFERQNIELIQQIERERGGHYFWPGT